MTDSTLEAYQPLRSVLYMPGANPRALAKAPTLPCDAVILDLEDSVAPEAKEQAREAACTAAKSAPWAGHYVTIRVNAIGTAWHEQDVLAACAAGPSAIVVPKVDTPEQAVAVAQVIAENAPEHTKMWAMIESPAGVLAAAEIAMSHARLGALVMGTNDLLKELRAVGSPDRLELLTSLQMVLLAARQAGIAALDGVFNAIKDSEGFVREAQQGAHFGFDGKTLIHPHQIAPAHDAYSPGDHDLEHAQAVVAAWQNRDGQGVATVNGVMIEQLHVDMALRTIAIADVTTRRQNDLNR